MARPAPRPAVREPGRARAQSTTRPARCTGPIPKPIIVSDASPEPANVPASLSHVQGEGESARAVMVDVSAKEPGRRVAVAGASVVFPPGVLAQVLAGQGPKGPVLEVARVAGIQAAKRTAELIPMCHPLGLDHVELDLEPSGEDVLTIRCTAVTTARTGVEMEALTGASLAALTVYDMTKALEKGIRIEGVRLLEKSGGRSGLWRAPEPA